MYALPVIKLRDILIKAEPGYESRVTNQYHGDKGAQRLRNTTLTRDQAIKFLTELVGTPNYLTETVHETVITQIAGHDHISENFHTLIEAWEKFWKNTDPAEKDTHPINKTVIEWLKNKGFNDQPAEVGASLIRPKWAAKVRRS